jgi:hypothetical protein
VQLSDSWYIYSESSNFSFNYEQSVQGQISPVDYRGRTLSPFHSFHEDVKINDVRVKERTAAVERKSLGRAAERRYFPAALSTSPHPLSFL